MKNIEIKVDRNTSYVDLPNNILGINGENLQGDIIMSFKNGFVDGIAWLEIEMPDKTKGYIMMDKVGEKYTLKIKSSLLTQVGLIHMNLRITEDENIDGIPVFKSNIFYLKVVESINATETIPDEYETWMDILNTKIVEVDNLNIELEKEDKKSTITITNKDGSVESVEVLDGNDGDDYILTQEDKNEIVDRTKPLVEAEIQPTLENIQNIAENAEVIARGRATGYVFDTVAELDSWLQNQDNISKLVLGDNLYVRALGVPDYWWDGTEKQILETEKPDLTEYAKKEQFVTLTQEEYDALEEKSATTYYFIPEEE